MRYTRLLAFIFALASIASRAQAFSDPAKFKAPVLEGGGGGRFFTGSPADGYACTVCHRGGKAPEVYMRGLPIDGYEPFKTYEVEVTWNQPEQSHALALEILTPEGVSAGKVELVDEEKLDAQSYCGQDVTLSLASYLTNAGERRIVGVTDCAAAALRFRFTAPDTPVVAFSMAVVVSNAKGDSEGDGALHLVHTLRRVGQRPPPTVGQTSCSAWAGRSAPDLVSYLIFSGLLLLRRLRTGRRALPFTAFLLLMGLSATGCATVAPYERETLARRDMELGENPDLAAGEEHAIAYREGSSGSGSAKGGGCGCN